MPITRAGDLSPGITLELGSGSLTASDLLESRSRRGHECSDRVLSDFRKATLDASSVELRLLAEALRSSDDHRILKWAVAVQDSTSFGLFRMLSAFLISSKIDLNVFRETEAARDWLEESRGVPLHKSAWPGGSS